MNQDKILNLICSLVSENKSEPVEHPFEKGEAYFFRTLTFHILGRIKETSGKFIILEDASWVADSGRFHEAFEKGEVEENEYIGRGIVNLDSVVDAWPWPNSLPKKSK